jgi:hypothetical protein
LSGNVFPAVGLATHYHTDWVVPYWSKSLEKIAQVGTHLFFRWPGYYGKQAAYSGRYASGEVVTGRIQALVEADQIDRAAGDVAAIDPSMESYMPKTVQLAGVTAVDLQGSAVRYANSATGDYIVRLEADAFPGSFAVLAHQMCKANDMCSVWGWTRPADMPMTFPIPAPAQRSASFLYEKTVARPTGVARWNCREFGDRPASQCLPGTAPASS